jgi:hypothetical protein
MSLVPCGFILFTFSYVTVIVCIYNKYKASVGRALAQQIVP